MNQSTCPHKWDWQKYGICTMCQQDMQNRHSANYITGEMLSRIQSISHTNDLPSRYVRMMASELLSLRNQIAQQQAELEFVLKPGSSEQQPFFTQNTEFQWHELLDRTHCVIVLMDEIVNKHELGSHPAIIEQASKAMESLGDLYQKIGEIRFSKEVQGHE